MAAGAAGGPSEYVLRAAIVHHGSGISPSTPAGIADGACRLSFSACCRPTLCLKPCICSARRAGQGPLHRICQAGSRHRTRRLSWPRRRGACTRHRRMGCARADAIRLLTLIKTLWSDGDALLALTCDVLVAVEYNDVTIRRDVKVRPTPPHAPRLEALGLH